MLNYTRFESPLGPIWLVGKGGRLLMVHLGEEEGFLKKAQRLGDELVESSQGLELPLKELDLYFSKGLETFKTPIEVKGTSFGLGVLYEVKKLKWGEVSTYKAIAERLGRPRAARAVGQALKRNLLPLFIPCHRVIGTKGDLGGYSAGLEFKIWLLKHEGVL